MVYSIGRETNLVYKKSCALTKEQEKRKAKYSDASLHTSENGHHQKTCEPYTGSSAWRSVMMQRRRTGQGVGRLKREGRYIYIIMTDLH